MMMERKDIVLYLLHWQLRAEFSTKTIILIKLWRQCLVIQVSFQHIPVSESVFQDSSHSTMGSQAPGDYYYQCQALPLFAGFSFGVDGMFIGLCLECFQYGKIFVLCAFTSSCTPFQWSSITTPRSTARTLFRNIRHVFKMPIEQLKQTNHPFLCPLSSLCSIYILHCLWFSICHTSTWSK